MTVDISRRAALGMVAGSIVYAYAKPSAAAVTEVGLSPVTDGARPITAEERGKRLRKLQDLLQQHRMSALLVESGSTLEYFTGVRWHRSERTTAALIPAHGDVVVVTPFFEQPSVKETLQVTGEVRPWHEDQSPFELLARAVRQHTQADDPVAVEATTRFFIVDGIGRLLGGKPAMVPGDELVRACRMFKSPAEIALLQAANDVTIRALRYVHGKIEAGMQGPDIERLMIQATKALGGEPGFSLVLLNEASAYPHGSIQPQSVRKGSVILMDCGCSVHGYQSDISRTWIFGEPTARQREIWNTVKGGQELALRTAAVGKPAGAIDIAVRAFYEARGWSKNYGLPGLSHRTGHGIGMDGHEAPYLVRSDTTPLQAGMCFSDEPGLYIPGEFGIRLEDCWYMTEQGPKLFTPLAASIDQPV